jgi:hypothetical protein
MVSRQLSVVSGQLLGISASAAMRLLGFGRRDLEILPQLSDGGQGWRRVLFRGAWVGRIEWRAVPGASEPGWGFGVRIRG